MTTNDPPPDLRLATERDLPPTTRCYWVVPGQLLAGAYPGSPNAQAHEARLTALSGAGIRTFVNLMEEHELNPQGLPLTPYANAVRDARLLRFAVRDLSIPSADLMRSILDAIDASLDEHRPAYVHCLGGVGRTGTVVGCWLLRHRLAGRDDVLSTLARLRRADVERGDRTAPETPPQREMVLGWNTDAGGERR